MGYSHHRVALFGKTKAGQERLASRISALSDITLNDDDGLPNLIVQSASGELKVWRTILNTLKGMRNRLLKI